MVCSLCITPSRFLEGVEASSIVGYAVTVMATVVLTSALSFRATVIYVSPAATPVTSPSSSTVAVEVPPETMV